MVSNRITEMEQLPNGEIWFATQDGISTYDGTGWLSFPDSLGILPIIGKVCLEALSDSSVYVLGFNGDKLSFSVYTDDRWSPLNLPPEIASLPLHSRYVMGHHLSGHGNSLIIGTQNKLYFYSSNQWTLYTLSQKDPESFKINSIKTQGDTVLIASSQGLHLYFNESLTTLVEHEDVLDLDYNEEDDTFYLLGKDWLGVLSSGSEEITFLFQDELIGYPDVGTVSNLMHHRGKLYYSSNSPLHQYDLHSHEKRAVITEYFDLDYVCMNAMVDHEGSLWVATLRGAFKVNNQDTWNFNSHFLLENEVSAILEDQNGDLYFGSNLGLNIVRSTGDIEKYPFPRKFIHARVMDMVSFEGNIYMAGNTAGVVSFKDGQFDFDLINENSRVLDLQVHEGRLYASCQNTIYRKDGNLWSPITTPQKDDYGIIRKMAFDDQRQLLLTQMGVSDLVSGEFIQSEILNDNNIYTGIQYDGQFLLGTANGVRVLEGNQIVHSPIYDHFDSPVYSFLADREGRLWVGTGKGIYLVSPNETYHLSKTNGLAGNEVNRNALVLSRNGKILVGTDEGISIYDPRAIPELPVPKIEYLGATVNGTPTSSQSFDHSENNIRFQYRSVSFYDEEHINYRLKLDGLEDQWQHIPFYNQHTILYSNLKPGTYQFMVQARIGNGGWSPTATSPVLTVKSAFYDNSWFRVGVLILVILLTLFLARLRSRTLKSRNELLQARVQEKTRELKNQNSRLMKTIKELKSAQGQLIQSEKLASMGHLTAGIAHELNNPLNYIRGGAECIMKNLEELKHLQLQLHAKESEPALLAEYQMLMDDSNQLAQSILNGASKSTDIVKSLSSFTADSQNFYSFTDLQKEVDTSLTLLNNQIGFRITINKMFGNIPPIECYPAKINQLLVNLLMNAVQAIEHEGEITIRYYRKDDKRIGLEISDDGVGIPQDLQEQVFEPFFTTKDTNPGLGLAIVKSIVQEHHGSIKLDSKPGKGTKVKIFLPVNQTAHPELEV